MDPINVKTLLIFLCMLVVFTIVILSYKSSLVSLSRKKRKEFKDSNSIEEYNRKIWFKNFDAIKDKKNKFDLPGPLQTLYGYHICDIIINDNSFMIIGKTNFFLSSLELNPTIFWYDNNKMKARNVSVKSLNDLSDGFEIKFVDERYSKPITFRIRGLSMAAKEKIKTGYNK